MANLTTTNGSTGELSPANLVAMLSPQDKSTIMSLCMPKGATDSELALYLYRCKELGFDPLSGELVLRKWVNNTDGSVSLSFITTRDALLKKAEQNPNYVGINSGVVKEGDTFQVDTEKGIVKHSFGAKRGKILAGWAIVYHKTRLPVIAIADFDEYYAANSSTSPVWRKMPSAMIQKVAEVAALRRQFPVLAQGIYTAEEMQTAEPAPVTVTGPTQPAMTVEVQPEIAEPVTPATTPEPVPEEPVPEEPVPETAPEPVPEPVPDDVYRLLAIQTGKSGTGTPYAKIACERKEQKLVLLAKGEEGVAEAGKLRDGCMFRAETVEEKGFIFVQKLTVVA